MSNFILVIAPLIVFYAGYFLGIYQERSAIRLQKEMDKILAKGEKKLAEIISKSKKEK